jgi:hypothetical protein
LGIQGRVVKQILGDDNPPPAVLPIITADVSWLYFYSIVLLLEILES